MRIAIPVHRGARRLGAALAVVGSLGLALVARSWGIAAGDGSDDAKQALQAAAAKLADRPGYRWSTTVEVANPGPFAAGGPTSGQAEKGGFTRVAVPGPGRVEFVTKRGKAAVRFDGNWQTPQQAARAAGPQAIGLSAGFNPNSIAGFKTPADELRGLIAKASDFRRDGDAIAATLKADAVDELLSAVLPRRGRGGRGGGNNQGDVAIQGAKGTATFQLKDGSIAKVTLALAGSRQFFNTTVQLDRTIITTIADLDNGRVEIPADAAEIVEAQLAGREPNVFVPEPGFKKLFDGRTLDGWRGKEGLWSVQDGAIVGRTTREHPTRGNTFLFAKGGDKDLIVDDFELRLSYKITADNDKNFANSGIQYRSKDKGNFVAAGYQADFEAGTTFSGILYDEAGGAGGRGIMALRGEQVTWTKDGKKEVTGHLGKSEDIQAKIKKDDWNEYTVIARGDHLQHFINGVPTVDVFDEAEGKRLTSGILALQLHAGEPMTVRFKDIRIKSLGNAAEKAAGNLKAPDGFKLEMLYSVPKAEQGSWVALCVDPKGRLIAADQNGKLYHVTPPPPGRRATIRPEPIDVKIAGAHGLLCAFDSLYVMVNERDTHGLYRVRDTDGDDRYDEVELLRAITGGGEHGMHSIVPSPDGKSLFVVCGNSTNLTRVDESRLPRTWGEDNLVPRIPTGFMDDSLAPQGWIARTDPDGKSWELIAAGFRNPFDIAFNHEGELFTYDADMEWDIGEPWYRPTRVNHVISGAEYGFRNGSGKWPDYYIDSFGAAVDIGPGSPTGITFGYGAKFPVKYQEALFLNDWSFGKLRAVHLKSEGASYTAEVEEFISGQPLPLTDVVINPHDGAMYFAVGGRGAQSALYRVTYEGRESTEEVLKDTRFQDRRDRDLRHKLEAFHGHADPKAVETAWAYLGDPDRALRYAARIAIEWQDPSTWRDRALAETDPRKAIAAMVALARSSGRDHYHRKPGDPAPDPALQGKMLETLGKIDWSRLAPHDRVDLVRAYALTFIRLGQPTEEHRNQLVAKFDPLFPSSTREENFILAQMLAYLRSPNAPAKLMAALREAPTQEEQIEYALNLRVLKDGWTPALREEYFRWFATRAATFRGGNTFARSKQTIRDQAIATLTDAERAALKPVLEAKQETKSPKELLASRPFVRRWTVAEAVPVVERGLAGGRDFERGRKLYGAVACASCHRFDRDGGSVGPDLSAVAGRFGVRDLLEAIVEPNKVISDQYAAISIETKDGRVVTGRVGNMFGDSISVVEDMLDPGHMTNVRRQDIEEMRPSPVSMMPAGLLDSLTAEEVQDLVAYLLSRGDPKNKMFK
ncbi:MAG TPA: family 16 glycoside hydrolase [Isosphaeraceae bacterium]|jgi:putative heme-binding domain-containing protein|nr:family 16 glycoside hydrolase [Isosphaeraceae bacterium]